MITNKDLSIDRENGKITLNGNKYDLGTQGEIDAVVKDVYSVMGQNGAKNLIPYPYYETTHVDNGITWTDNGDGTVTANGTATANSIFNLQVYLRDYIPLTRGQKYILTGCPSGGSGTKYKVSLYEGDTSSAQFLAQDFGNGAEYNNLNYSKGLVWIVIYKGQTVSNLTFKPMLRLAADTDDTYQPYAKTNKQLTETIGDLTQTYITGASVAAQLGVLGEILGFTHFVRIPYTTGVLESIEAAFENGTIPSDIMGLTIGMLRGQAGSQRVIFIAQNQTDPSTTQTRYAAIYFGAYTAPRFCQKQDGSAWTDVAL